MILLSFKILLISSFKISNYITLKSFKKNHPSFTTLQTKVASTNIKNKPNIYHIIFRWIWK